jgi:hypothetical protein
MCVLNEKRCKFQKFPKKMNYIYKKIELYFLLILNIIMETHNTNMDPIFSDDTFLNKIKQLPYGKKVLQIMSEIKAQSPDLNINVFLCILEKFISPRTSNSTRSASQYLYAVELWNNYVFQSKKNFNLLLSYEDIRF